MHPRIAILFVLLAGCASTGAEPSSATAPAADADALDLEACDVHQAIVAVDRAEARALVPEEYEVAGFPLAGAPDASGFARMDAPFVRCERVLVDGVDLGPFTYFGAGILIVPPDGPVDPSSNVSTFFAIGQMASPPEAARVLAAWGVAPTEAGLVEGATSGLAFEETSLVATSASGEARLSDRIAPVTPLARPAEVYRLFGPGGAELDYVIQPHDAILGEGVLTIDGDAGWLADVPAPRAFQSSAHAGAPTWNVRIVRA